jgi:hypothetical protein
MKQLKDTFIDWCADILEEWTNEAPWLDDWGVIFKDLEDCFMTKLTKQQKRSIIKKLAERDIY